MSKLKLLDLFSGIGGFSLGLERTGGFETVAFCEYEEARWPILNKHWPNTIIYKDVKEINGKELTRKHGQIDVITGGFPCQDLSVCGHQRGIEAERSLKSSVWLAKLDPVTLSWRTSQTCFLAPAKNLEHGLAEFCQTWPASGMMQNGKIYQRQPWALPIAESVSGLWPTPLKSDLQAKFTAKSIRKVLPGPSQEHLCYRPLLMGWGMHQTASLYAVAMGFPSSWANLTLTETQ